MTETKEFDFEPGFVPPKNLQYFLLILRHLKKVQSRIKLFKIHYLIEKEGHVKFDLPIDTYEFGPVDYVSFNFCVENGLIESRVLQGVKYEYYETSLTERGKRFFEIFCKPNMHKSDIKKALRIIEKYRKYQGMKILEYVHKNYVDPFTDNKKVREFIKEFENKLDIFLNLSQKQLQITGINKDSQYTLLGELYHIKEILKSLRDIKDPTKIGTILKTIFEFFGSLEANKYLNNPVSVELFEFLDNYCNKEGVHKSIASDDFSDIPEEERKCLLKAVAQIKIPPCS